MSTFTCYICKETFDMNRPNSEAIAEFEQRFEGEKIIDAVLICNKCDSEIKQSERWIDG